MVPYLRIATLLTTVLACCLTAVALLQGAPGHANVDFADVIGEAALGLLVLVGLVWLTRQRGPSDWHASLYVGLGLLLLSSTLDVADEVLEPGVLAAIFENVGKTLGSLGLVVAAWRWRSHQESLEADIQKFEVASQTDCLTGLGNRGAFDGHLASSVIGGRFALLILDIDNFKQHNDTWGHPEGDMVIQELGRTIIGSLRGSDQAFRYGGEEFAVVLQDVSAPAACVVAERIRSTFAERVFQPQAGVRVQKTISIGLAMRMPGDTVESWLARADAALYAAKRTGKNKVMLGKAEAACVPA